jgi:hypothetical protein
MSLEKWPRDSQETFARTCQIGHEYRDPQRPRSMPMPGHQRSRKPVPNPNRRRALKLLASCRDGCTEAIMSTHGFTIKQMVNLVRVGLATGPLNALSPVRARLKSRVRITEAGARYAGRCEVTGSGYLTERTMANQIDDDEPIQGTTFARSKADSGRTDYSPLGGAAHRRLMTEASPEYVPQA